MTDTKLMLTEVEGEPRIRDLDLAERLGFERPTNIRKLIKRHEAELAQLGVCATWSKPPGADGGRPTTEYFLNRRQAIYITAKSGTPTAASITIEIIERFDAYERGAAPAALVAMSDDEVMARGYLMARKRVEALEAAVADQRPKAEALDRIAGAEGAHRITDAAKVLQVRPSALFD